MSDFATSWTTARQDPLSSTSSWGCSDSGPLNQWCYLTISSSPVPFSFCLQSFPPSGSFPVSQVLASGGQNIGASASVLPVNIQGWFPLRLTGLISLLSKGLSRVFSGTTIRKHQFFGTQPSSVEGILTSWALKLLPALITSNSGYHSNTYLFQIIFKNRAQCYKKKKKVFCLHINFQRLCQIKLFWP